jgi:nitrogen regulatory protein PII
MFLISPVEGPHEDGHRHHPAIPARPCAGGVPEVGILGMNVTECCGYGHQHGLTDVHCGEEYINTLLPKVMLQLAVPVTEAIIKGARTGRIGDGKIFIVPIDEVIGISTNERDQQALI